MTIDVGEHLHRHAKVASGVPDIHPCLHPPGDTGVSQSVRDDVAAKAALNDKGPEGLVNFGYRPAVELDSEGLSIALPPTKMSQKGSGQRNCGLALLRGRLSVSFSNPYATIEVNEAMFRALHECRVENVLLAGPGVEREENKPRQMTPRMPLV
jgi:hypothetical protein